MKNVVGIIQYKPGIAAKIIGKFKICDFIVVVDFEVGRHYFFILRQEYSGLPAVAVGCFGTGPVIFVHIESNAFMD